MENTINEFVKENILLKEENEKLKKLLENYNNSRKIYYEKNKELVNEKAKERLKKLAQENPDIREGENLHQQSVYAHMFFVGMYEHPAIECF